MGQEELKFRRLGHVAMMEQDVVIIGYEANMAANLLFKDRKKIGVRRLVDIRAVVILMPLQIWENMGFTWKDLIPTNLRMAATNRGDIYVVG